MTTTTSKSPTSLKDVIIADCGFHKPPIHSVPPTTPLSTAMKSMAASSVTSLGIQSHSNPSKIVSVITAMDVMHFLLKKEAGMGPDGEGVKKAVQEGVEHVQTLDSENESYRMVEFDVNDTLEPSVSGSLYSQLSPLAQPETSRPPPPPRATLHPPNPRQVLRSFSHHIHRAIVTDATHRTPPFMLTQTDVLKHAHAHSSLTTATVSPTATVADLFLHIHSTGSGSGPPRRAMVTVTKDMTAWEAMGVLARENVRAVPVLDGPGGPVVATLGVADLRGMTEVVMYRFKMPLLEFLSWNRQSHLVPTLCLPSTTFAELLDLMVTRPAHEVWVVESLERGKEKCVGVVGQTDV
ncbi:hypothetical protein HDU93_003994, partial [Gonapodya sp. JEL0774]